MAVSLQGWGIAPFIPGKALSHGQEPYRAGQDKNEITLNQTSPTMVSEFNLNSMQYNFNLLFNFLNIARSSQRIQMSKMA